MAHPVDQHVGQRVRAQRRLMGLTQQQLATSIGIKFQQVQKYETGMNRISASKLWDISQTLRVPVEHFFVGIDESSSSEDDILVENDDVDIRELSRVIKTYRQLSKVQRQKFFQLAQTLLD